MGIEQELFGIKNRPEGQEFKVIERADGSIAVLAGDKVLVDSGVTPVTAVPSAEGLVTTDPKTGKSTTFAALGKSSGNQEVVIYGATFSGIMAAIACRRGGARPLVIATNNRIGGMVTAGLAITDIRGKNPRVYMNVLTQDFYRRCAAYYGETLGHRVMYNKSSIECWIANRVLKEMVAEYDIPILYNHRVTAVNKQVGEIVSITTQNRGNSSDVRTIYGKVFIDASYETDLLIRSGASYTYGREANATYSETYNGVRASSACTGTPDPYVTPGNAGSGLLAGVDSAALEAAGTVDNRLQAFCHRLIVTNDPAHRRPFPAPTNYHPEWYELIGRAMANAPTSFDSVGKVVGPTQITGAAYNKWEWNSASKGLSLNAVSFNSGYVTTDYAARDQIEQNHLDYTLGFLKWLQLDPRVPAGAKSGFASWGLCDDEFTDDNNTGMSPEIYIREAARMVGEVVTTESHFNKTTVAKDPIALTSYPIDSHIVSYRNVGGVAHYEGLLNGSGTVVLPTSYYGIDYKSMLPKSRQVSNMLVCCNGVSASHTVYGGIRMELTFGALGEAAGTAAALAVKAKMTVHEIAGADLLPYIRKTVINPARVLVVSAPTTNGTITASTAGEAMELVSADPAPPEFYGTSIARDNNYHKGLRFQQFFPSFGAAGRFRIYLNAPGVSNSQPWAKVEVKSAAGVETLYIDHKEGEWYFRDLGVWAFNNDGTEYIKVINSGDPGIAGSDVGNLYVEGVAWNPVP